jgi:hypothetical protein
MTVPVNLKWIVAAIGIGLGTPALCLAGRPVFHELSLSELTQAAKLIAVVTCASTETIAKGPYGCESIERRMSIVAIIKISPGVNAKPGQTIDVRQNASSYQDCVFREGWKTAGASFEAYRYKPSVSDAQQQERFIVFLEPSERGFRLTADHGYDSIARKQEIESLLNR